MFNAQNQPNQNLNSNNMFSQMAPSWHGRYPWMPNFHFPNNPAASASMPQPQKADVGGINQAMQKISAQDNNACSVSSAGESGGVTYKHDNEGHATGQSAFDTLDGYMKKAGLNAFQAQFFTRLIANGLDDSQIKACVKKAGEEFGEKVGAELNSGFEKLAFMPVVQGLGRMALQGAKYIAPKLTQYGTKQVAKQGLRQGLKATGQRAAQQAGVNLSKGMQTAKALGSRQGLRDFGQGFSSMAATGGNKAMQAGKALGNFAKGKGAKGQFIQGAVSGAVNPFTGAHTWVDDQGNFDYTKALASMGGGAALSRLGGVPLLGAQRRAMVGEGVGAGLGLGANALGFDVDPTTLAQAGYIGGGLTPRNLKGLVNPATYSAASPATQQFLRRPLVTGAGKGLMDKVDPFGQIYRAGAAGVKKLAPFAKANPGQAAMIGGGLAAGAGGIAAPIVAGRVAADGVRQTQEGLMPLANYAAETLGKVNNAVDNPIGTLMGGVGNYMQQNPMMALALLGGLGAAGGGMMGGGTGATLGGIGLPLAYMLASGQNPLAMLQGQQAPQYGVQNQQSLGPAMQGLPSRNEGDRTELERQQDMQDGLAPTVSQAQGQGPDIEALLQKASPEQLSSLQDPNVPDAVKNEILQQLVAQ